MPFLPLALLLLQDASPAGPRADYLVRVDPEAKRAHVSLSLAGLDPAAEAVELRMVERFAFTSFERARVSEPWSLVVGEERRELPRSGPFAWTAAKGRATALRVEYEAPLDHRDWPEVDARGDYEMPRIAADHGMLSCGALFAVPELDGVRLRVRFELPAAWRRWPVLAPWPEVGTGVFAPVRARDLQDNLVALGDWETHRSDAGSASALVAFAPGQRAHAGEVAPLVATLFAQELALFGEPPLERYVFLFVPSRVRGFAGSAKQGSMVLSLGAGLPPGSVARHAGHLIAHELFHTWASSRFGAPDELRFFSEGFTDYYAYQILRRAGLLDGPGLERVIGEKLAEHERAAERTGLSLVDAGGPAFFEGKGAYQQIYAGGLVLAALCEQHLRPPEPAGVEPDATAGLDGLMRAFHNDRRWSHARPPGLEDLLALLRERGGAELEARVRALVATPRADLAAALRDAGCRVERVSEPLPLDLRANLEGTRIVDLDPGCAAALLGLAAGDELLEVNGVPVATPGECASAFQRPVAGRVRVRYRRGGDELAIDAAPPRVERIEFAWKR